MRLIRSGWKPVPGRGAGAGAAAGVAAVGPQTIDNLNEFLSNTALTWPGTNDE